MSGVMSLVTAPPLDIAVLGVTVSCQQSNVVDTRYLYLYLHAVSHLVLVTIWFQLSSRIKIAR